MHRMKIHCQQREVDIVGIGQRAAGPMLVDCPQLKIFEIAAIARLITLMPYRLNLHDSPLCSVYMFVRTKCRLNHLWLSTRFFTLYCTKV